MSKTLRVGRAVLGASLLAAGVALFIPGTALAHHPIVTGQAECIDPDTGQWGVQWTAASDDPSRGKEWRGEGDHVWDWTNESNSQHWSTSHGLGQTSVTQTVHAFWRPDGGNGTASATVTRPDNCDGSTTTTTTTTTTTEPTTTSTEPTTTSTEPTTSSTPTSSTPPSSTPPSSTPATPGDPLSTDVCGTSNDTYTIASTPGVNYFAGGVATPAGTHPAGSSSVTITAQASPGYVLQGPSSWTFSFTDEACAAGSTTPPTSPNVRVSEQGPKVMSRPLATLGVSLGQLPETGSSVAPTIGVASALLFAGAIAVLAARRQAAAH